MLRWRLISAAIIVSTLLAVLHFDFHDPIAGVPGLLLAPLAILISVMAALELLDFFKDSELRPVPAGVLIGTTLVVLMTCAPMAWKVMDKPYPADCPLGRLGWPLCGFALAVAMLGVMEVKRYEGDGKSTIRWAVGCFMVAYCGVFMSFIVSLRVFESNAWGMAALIGTILVTKITDTGAYTFGRLFGKNKLAPKLSPGKTIEGVVGGALTAVVTAWAYFTFAVPQLIGMEVVTPWYGWVIFGVVVSVAGIFGDLFESMLKRDMQRKDSSRWLPGLGGVLDIMDSLLIAAPAGYACFVLGLVGPG